MLAAAESNLRLPPSASPAWRKLNNPSLRAADRSKLTVVSNETIHSIK